MLFNPKILAVANLLVQAVLLGTVLLAAYLAKTKRQLIKHCRIIRAAVIVQLVAIFLIMLPSLLGYLKSPGLALRNEMVLHHSIGLLLILLWVYINLAVMGRVRVLGGLKWYMRAAASIWLFLFLLGLDLFFRIYVLS